MRPRDREIEVDEAQVTVALIVALLVVAGIFYLGLWVGGWLAGGGAPSPPPPTVARSPGRALPAGWIGPPAPPYPPPVGERAGAGRSGHLAVAIREFVERGEAERAMGDLIAGGFPAYLVPRGQDRWQLRVGDYGTLAEAESVRSQLAEAGAPPSGLLEL